MGRSFVSVRMEVKALTGRWARASRALGGQDRQYASRIVEMARRHLSESYYAFDDPLEAALFSVLIELLKERGRCSVDH